MRRPNPGEDRRPKEARFIDHDFEAKYPTLAEYMTCTVYDDNKYRRTATLLLFVDDGVLRLCLNDRDTNRSAFVTAGTMEEALSAMEMGLLDGSLDWRNKQNYSGGEKKTPY